MRCKLSQVVGGAHGFRSIGWGTARGWGWTAVARWRCAGCVDWTPQDVDWNSSRKYWRRVVIGGLTRLQPRTCEFHDYRSREGQRPKKNDTVDGWMHSS